MGQKNGKGEHKLGLSTRDIILIYSLDCSDAPVPLLVLVPMMRSRQPVSDNSTGWALLLALHSSPVSAQVCVLSPTFHAEKFVSMKHSRKTTRNNDGDCRQPERTSVENKVVSPRQISISSTPYMEPLAGSERLRIFSGYATAESRPRFGDTPDSFPYGPVILGNNTFFTVLFSFCFCHV